MTFDWDQVRVIRRHDPRPADNPVRLADEADGHAIDEFIRGQLQAAADWADDIEWFDGPK